MAIIASAGPGSSQPSGGGMGLVLVSSTLLAAHGGSLEITLAPTEATVAGPAEARLAGAGGGPADVGVATAHARRYG